jgi:hypothetical protein
MRKWTGGEQAAGSRTGQLAPEILVAAGGELPPGCGMGAKYIPSKKDQKANQRFRQIELRKSKAKGAKETRPDSNQRKK